MHKIILDQILHDELESMYFREDSEIQKSDILLFIKCDLDFTEQELDEIMQNAAKNNIILNLILHVFMSVSVKRLVTLVT